MLKIQKPLNLIAYSVSIVAVGPLYIWLSLPAQIFLPVAFVCGFGSDLKGHYLLRGHIVTVLSLAFFLFYASQLSLANIVEPVVNMVAILFGMRLFTEKNGRNYLQIFVLSLFALASSSMFSVSIVFFPALIFLVFGITIGLVLLTFYTREPGLRLPVLQFFTIIRTAAILPVVSLVLMLLFFVILPRTEHPLWHFINMGASAVSGFSDEVRPGSIANMTAGTNIAFRAQCPTLPQSSLYWRGTVLNTIDNETWSRSQLPSEKSIVTGGKTVQCSLYLPIQNNNFLFSLDLPLSLSGVRHQKSNDLVFLAKRRMDKSTKIDVTSRVGGTLKTVETVDESFYLRTPPLESSLLVETAAAIRKEGASRQERVELLKSFFIRQNLTYANDDLPGPDAPIETFLFSKKRGYCEFFASSFALLLRMADVPSRLVGGYYGGNYNNLGGYYQVTDAMAHVWVEALVDGSWLRIDPTRLAQNYVESPLGGRRSGFSLLRQAVDSIDYFWTQAVITYDFKKQFSLVRNAGNNFRSFQKNWNMSWQDMYPLLCICLSVFIIWSGLHWKMSSREERILKQYHSGLRKKYRNEPIPRNMGLHELASRLKDPLCQEFAEIFTPALYSEHNLTKEEYLKMQHIIRALKKRKKE